MNLSLKQSQKKKKKHYWEEKREMIKAKENMINIKKIICPEKLKYY